MSTTQVSIRLGVEGKAEVKRAFDEVGKAGQDAFRGVATSMDAAGAAADRETQRLQRLAQAAKQAAAADQAQRSFNQVLGVGTASPKSAWESAAVFEDTAKAAEDLAARTAALRAQIDPLGEAQRRMNVEIAEADDLFEAGAISQKEHGDAVALAKDRYDLAAEALGGLGTKSNLTSGQVRALISTFQLAANAATTGEVSIAKLSIQAFRLGKAFGADSGGVTGIFGGVGRALASLVTPTAAVVTRAIRTWLDPAEKARRLDELEIRALQAKTPAQKAAIAEERRRLELAGQAFPVAIAEADITRVGTKARAEATQAHIDQSRVVEVNTRATLGLAEAWLKGAAAAQAAEVRRKALTEAVQNGVDVETRARELLREQIAEQAAQSAKSVNDLTAEADAQRRLNDAVLVGRLSTEQAQRQMQVEQALRPLIIAQSLAEGEAKTTLARIVDHLRSAYARFHGEQARAAALQTLESQRNQVELLQKQIELAGTRESQRAIIIAQLQAEQQLRQKGIDLAGAEGQAIIANAAAIERLNQELARSQGAMQALQGITDTTFNRFANLIAEGKLDWKSWADAGRAAIADIEKEILKLAVLNPFKNFLFGTNLPTLSNVGGLFGNLFGGVFGGAGAGLGPAASAARLFGSPIYHAGAIAGDAAPTRLVPRDLFRIAPRLHDGAFLSPDEVPAILQRGERVLSREETRRYAERTSMPQPVINVVIQTPNPAAFQASRTQVAADLARAVRMGTRGM